MLKKANSSFTVFLLIVAALISLAPPMPIAHATGCTGNPGYDTSAHAETSGSPDNTVAVTLSSNCTGDIVVAICLMSVSTHFNPPSLSISDSGSILTHNRVQASFGSLAYLINEQWGYSSAALSGDVVTCTVSPTNNADGVMNMVVFTFQEPLSTSAPFDPNAGLPDSAGCSSGTCTTVPLAYTTSTAADTLFDFASNSGSNTVTQDGSFTTTDTTAGGATAAYKVVSTTQSSYTPTLSFSSSTFAFALGDAIQQGSALVTTTIAPCNFFEIQCWWYPLLFIGLYSGFILMVGTWLRATPRGKAHLFLSAVTFGSLVAVIFGIMNIVFPLLMLVVNTVIALRLRG